ncbi:MAG TPA: hypothetical protein ENK21_09655 [Trueperaceae bacterium]|nr:hypothetical protein [Trueperaceae bacterium]
MSSSVTGILRVQAPFDDIKNADIRFASQQIVLEQAGVESRGDINFSYQDQELDIQNAEFFGSGHWLASGKASSQELSLNMNAEDANFDAIIALIPQLSIFDVGASGSLSISSSGSLNNPNLVFDSSALNISVANTRYILSAANMKLINDKLTANGKLVALSPITGELSLTASGKIRLLPWQVDDFVLDFNSASTQLTIGELKNLSGTISRNKFSDWQIDAKGYLGDELNISGNLNPFNVDLTAENIDIIAPRYFIANANLNTDINIRYDKGFFITGEIVSNEANLIIAGREKRPKQEASRALEHIHFDRLKLLALQKIFLNEPVGSAELNMNLILTGTAAVPELQGRADTVRGDFRFSGRSFIIDSAAAVFQRSRGIYPLIDIKAHSSISKREILRGVEDRLSIIEPKSDTVEISLDLKGSVEKSQNSNAAFKLDLVPNLSSNVIIQDPSFNNPRKLNETELYSLLTLAKIELATNISDTGGVAETALQGALDTAIDVLILSSLQKELGNALGVDIFEIRTTPISALIDGQEDFGVSLRIGAYLEDDVFASYRFTSLGYSSDLTLSHEFSIRYDLPPLSLDLRGRLNFFENNFYKPSPSLAIDLTYAFSDFSSIELGFDFSNESQSVNFGVSFRW